MNIKEINAKVIKGEPLSDEEKAFLQSYDPDKVVNDAAAAARRKAELETEGLKAKIKEIEDKAKADAEKAEADKANKMTETQRREAQFVELQKSVEALTKANAEAEKKVAAAVKRQKIEEKAKSLGIVLAPKTVSEKMFRQMLDHFLSDVNESDDSALTSALEAFKAENPGIIAAPGSGSGVDTGTPESKQKQSSSLTAEQRQAQMKKDGLI